MLEKLDLDRRLDKADYRHRLPLLQARLLQLQQACWRANIPSVLVFEGWDGAGKGSSIRKLTERLEPRGYRLSYLTDRQRTHEKRLPWMRRFWLEIPHYGQMTIFHRSWNRKAILDRANGRLSELEWHRVFRDILDFERSLSDDGYVFIKCFLHISKKERRKRYKAMEKDPATSWRITRRSWQHHRRYEELVPLVEWMLERTETAWAPWRFIEANDRRWARISVFETVIRRLEEALSAAGNELPEIEDTDTAASGGEGT
ncbi:MAG: UDP-galactose-lipid carrier transferase [Acidobacteriota bacterium]